MALEYATALTLLDSASGAPAALADVAKVVGAWAGVEDFEPADLELTGRNDARVVTRLLDPGDPDMWAWSLTMDVTNEDASGEQVDWTAVVTVIESTATRVSVRVERTAREERLRPLATRPQPPRVVSTLIDSEQFVAVDGHIPVTTRPLVLAPSDVDDFVARTLLAADRRLPVVGISQAPAGSADVVDPERLASQLAGIAHVWIVPNEATWRLSDVLTPKLGVYNGAVRLWWPGLAIGDNPFEHGLWLRRSGAREIERRVIDLVLDTAGTRFAQPKEITELADRVRRADDEKLKAELGELLECATRPQVVDAVDSASELKRLEESVREKVVALETDRDAALSDLIQLSEERERLARENARLESEILRLKARAGFWEETAEPEVDLSAEELFLNEVEDEYQTRFTGADRDRFPLAPMKVGRSFLASLEQIDVPRAKVVQVCTEVASRRARDIPGRQVHPLRTSEAGNAPQRRRGADAADAWRCYLENRTPQAGRLHWWSVGETVEFAAVVRHDDTSIPE